MLPIETDSPLGETLLHLTTLHYSSAITWLLVRIRIERRGKDLPVEWVTG